MRGRGTLLVMFLSIFCFGHLVLSFRSCVLCGSYSDFARLSEGHCASCRDLLCMGFPVYPLLALAVNYLHWLSLALLWLRVLSTSTFDHQWLLCTLYDFCSCVSFSLKNEVFSPGLLLLVVEGNCDCCGLMMDQHYSKR